MSTAPEHPTEETIGHQNNEMADLKRQMESMAMAMASMAEQMKQYHQICGPLPQQPPPTSQAGPSSLKTQDPVTTHRSAIPVPPPSPYEIGRASCRERV